MRFPRKLALMLLCLVAWPSSSARAQIGWYSVNNGGYCGYVSGYGPYLSGAYVRPSYVFQRSFYRPSYYGGVPAYPVPYTPANYYGRAYAQPDFTSGGSFYTPGSYVVPPASRPTYYYGGGSYAPGSYGSYYYRP